MKEELLEALIEYIDKLIDVKIEDAFGRDAGQESIAAYDAKVELKRLAIDSQKGEASA